jgi:hypothetical protein
MSKGTMMTAQRYCVLCVNRQKGADGKTYCVKYSRGVQDASRGCQLLMPFVRHKEEKERERKHSN